MILQYDTHRSWLSCAHTSLITEEVVEARICVCLFVIHDLGSDQISRTRYGRQGAVDAINPTLHSTALVRLGVPMKVAESIAIVGIGCRMPGQVGRPNDLWKLLAGAADAIC